MLGAAGAASSASASLLPRERFDGVAALLFAGVLALPPLLPCLLSGLLFPRGDLGDLLLASFELSSTTK
eukprot:CAMPEP_0119394842 /NCGR_PEP_ID=MMETSP1334-20130426/130967_1 /TAXON_ID=127549 /ORGANISM="Calcidiscus leptoporus, Strain RCC1130" /LENGTH=68 /DNA_ID=CAMNT_0007418201 /DNA_START=358 /DNA_END=564 /DNA_ORIENTATION=-